MNLVKFVRSIAVAASTIASGAVFAAEPVPFINSASNLFVGSTAELNGGNFPGKAAITLAVTSPKGVTSTELIASDHGGKVKASLLLTEAGRYVVKATDAFGKPLASTIVVARGKQP